MISSVATTHWFINRPSQEPLPRQKTDAAESPDSTEDGESDLVAQGMVEGAGIGVLVVGGLGALMGGVGGAVAGSILGGLFGVLIGVRQSFGGAAG